MRVFRLPWLSRVVAASLAVSLLSPTLAGAAPLLATPAAPSLTVPEDTLLSPLLPRPELAPDRYFVGLAGGVTAEAVAAVEALGVRVRQRFPEIGAVAVEVREPDRLAALRESPVVASIEQEPMRYPLDLATAQLVPAPLNGLYGLVMTGATAAHERGVRGGGINVGVADTSINYHHPDIAPNYRGGIDTVADDMDPFNDDGQTHGTHVAATILAVDDAQGVLGVAPSANLYHARVLGPDGGSSSDIMAGVRWLVETAGCKVVNLSLGGGRRSAAEERFYEEMRAKGVLIVCASGNESRTRVSYPAGYAVNIAVGAVDRNGAAASFSNRGEALDVVAPGVAVLSAVPPGRGNESSVTTTTTYSATALTFGGATEGISAVLVACGLGRPGEFPLEVAGNVALIQRGELTFADKVRNAMDAGAVAAIIYNNGAGDYAGTLGTEAPSEGRTWIPALAVSDAAGAELLAHLGTGVRVLSKRSDWAVYNGTSMATPHVAGVIALLWSADPTLAPEALEALLRATCTDLGEPGFDTTYGWGLVNADAALTLAAPPPPIEGAGEQNPGP